jgi:hypothetical protein
MKYIVWFLTFELFVVLMLSWLMLALVGDYYSQSNLAWSAKFMGGLRFRKSAQVMI